jgi:hypothetical protein
VTNSHEFVRFLPTVGQIQNKGPSAQVANLQNYFNTLEGMRNRPRDEIKPKADFDGESVKMESARDSFERSDNKFMPREGSKERDNMYTSKESFDRASKLPRRVVSGGISSVIEDSYRQVTEPDPNLLFTKR